MTDESNKQPSINKDGDESFLVFRGPEYADMCLEPEESLHMDVSLDDVITLLERGEELWGPDVGGASLHWCVLIKEEEKTWLRPVNDRPSLLILKNRKFGIHFCIDAKDQRFIAIQPGVKSVRVEHEICGEEAWFPSATFVSMDIGRQIVQSFIRDRTRYAGIEWVESSEYRYDLPDAWKEFSA